VAVGDVVSGGVPPSDPAYLSSLSNMRSSLPDTPTRQINPHKHVDNAA
jgi:hypothetical protein